MIRIRRRAYRRTHGNVLAYPDCLPALEELEAAYFGKISPSLDGVIVNEAGTAGDAQLVDGNAIKLDGATHAVGDATGLFIDSELEIEIKGSFDSAVLAGQAVCAVVDNANLRSFIIYKGSVPSPYYCDIQLYDNAGAVHVIKIITNILDNGFFYSKLIFKEGVATTYNMLTGAVIDSTTLDSIRVLPNSKYLVSSYTIAGAGQMQGMLSCLKIGKGIINCAEGGLCDVLVNSGTAGGDAALTGTLSTIRSGKIDNCHPNIFYGFDLWTNGVLGEEIRVPIGYNLVLTGYSFVSSNLAGAWHNNAESAIQLPATLAGVTDGDVPNPLHFADWQENFGGTNKTFSVLDTNKNSKFTAYNRALMAEEEEQVLKCLSINTSTLTQIAGEYTVIDGIYTRIGD